MTFLIELIRKHSATSLVISLFLFFGGIVFFARTEAKNCEFQPGDKVLINGAQPALVTRTNASCISWAEWFTTEGELERNRFPEERLTRIQ